MQRDNGKSNTMNNSKVSITVKINGEEKIILNNQSILRLIEGFNLNMNSVVVELNKNILAKEKYNYVSLEEGDELEIITFVGGG